MPIELQMLVYAALLALLQIVLYSVTALRQLGLGFAVGPRDEQKAVTGIAGRCQRALHNHLQTLPLFAIAVFTAHLTSRTGPETALAAQVYFWTRAAYVPAYISGVPWLRSSIWAVAMACIIVIFWQLLG